MGKASMKAMNELHGAVAKFLKENLDDGNITQAIKFLKDNNITVDLVEDVVKSSLSDSIEKYINKDKEDGNTTRKKLSIAEMTELIN